MIADKEMTEYHSLCALLGILHEKFLLRKQELRLLLEEAAALKRDALIVLAKANDFTRYLTGYQRQVTGLTYHPGEIKARITQFSPVVFGGDTEETEPLPEIRADFRNRRDLRQKGLIIIGMIDNIRKKLLQLDLLEQRCRELLLSVRKALEAFRHEWKIIRRKIYPLGVLSLCHRSLRRLWGRSYFFPGDLDDISALGRITGHVLKIADSPLL